jgi:mono/diheme cytochrome c family protein
MNRRFIMMKHLILLTSAALAFLALAHFSQGTVHSVAPDSLRLVATENPSDDAASREAFLAAYKVLMHPRCMNCHPAGDVPLQGDDSHLHSQNVQRGPEGKGKFALKCANCHQETNLPGANMPPGNPTWHLPPPSMRMVFQGKSPRELAEQLKDPKRNGGKKLEQILHHVTEDKLVLWGWNPGDGRTKPPLTHAEFAQKMKEWIEKGAAVPE